MSVNRDPKDACVAVDEEAVANIVGHGGSGCRSEAENAFDVHLFGKAGYFEVLWPETRTPLC